MGYVAIDDSVALIVLVDHVEGLAVPDAQVEALPVHHVVTQNALQFLHLRLEVDHDFGGLSDFL